MQGIFTISRNDFYDFLQCPKIVSLKSHRVFTRPAIPPRPRVNRNLPYEISTIGEIATRAVLSESSEDITEDGDIEEDVDFDIEEERAPRLLEINLAKKGVQLDEQMKNILKETLDGLKTIKKYLTDEYGKIKILGRAESRNGLLPGKIRPDFIAMSSELKRPILIEVKNAGKLNSKPHNFQAVYYNSITQKHGALLLEERTEGGKNTIIPKLIQDVLPETLLVYPRLKGFQIVSETIDITPKIVNEIWQAKQLGILGKSPHTDCDSKCAHHRYGELPEDNIEAAKPLPLIFARGLQEQGQDLDSHYLFEFLGKKGLRWELKRNIWEFDEADIQLDYWEKKDPKKFAKKKKTLKEKREQYLQMFSQKTGLSKITIDKLIGERNYIWKKSKKIENEMKDEIQPWKKMLGKEKSKLIGTRTKGFTTRIYALPEKSDEFVNKSWKKWGG